MFRNLSLFACVFVFSFFSSAVLAESVGCGNTCSSTSTETTTETDDSDGTLLDWFFGGSEDTSE